LGLFGGTVRSNLNAALCFQVIGFSKPGSSLKDYSSFCGIRNEKAYDEN
jgi:hypothetical protein